MANPIRLNIKGNKVAAGRTDVVINDPSLANALVKDSASVFVEIQKSYGATVSLDEIEVDHNGAVVISNSALANAVKAKLADPGSDAETNYFCPSGNAVCGSLDPIDLVGRVERIERRLGS
jgi:hypothetical protein